MHRYTLSDERFTLLASSLQCPMSWQTVDLSDKEEVWHSNVQFVSDGLGARVGGWRKGSGIHFTLFKECSVTHMSVCSGAYSMEWKGRDGRVCSLFFFFFLLSISSLFCEADKPFSPLWDRVQNIRLCTTAGHLGHHVGWSRKRDGFKTFHPLTSAEVRAVHSSVKGKHSKSWISILPSNEHAPSSI